MALELGTILLEAAISLAQTAWERDNNTQEQVLLSIANTVTEIKSQLDDVHQLLLKRKPPSPEVARFRRARVIAQSIFAAEWDQTLLNFGTELLAMTMSECVTAVKVSVEGVVPDPDKQRAIRFQVFEAVVLAQKAVQQNANRLASFLQDVLNFNNSRSQDVGSPV